jgi:hypothetical protein
VSGVEIGVGAAWPLRAAMEAVARRRGVAVRERAGDGSLPGAAELDELRTSLALGAIADVLTPAPTSVTATIVAPAAGVCGPAAAGPIDAIRDGGRAEGSTAGRSGIPWSAQTVSVQQTRCWLLSAVFAGTAPPRPGDVGLEILPAVVAADTARISQFQLDRGLGAHWPGVLLLRPPVRAGDGVAVTAVYTDGLPATYLLEKALRANPHEKALRANHHEKALHAPEGLLTP